MKFNLRNVILVAFLMPVVTGLKCYHHNCHELCSENNKKCLDEFKETRDSIGLTCEADSLCGTLSGKSFQEFMSGPMETFINEFFCFPPPGKINFESNKDDTWVSLAVKSEGSKNGTFEAGQCYDLTFGTEADPDFKKEVTLKACFCDADLCNDKGKEMPDEISADSTNLKFSVGWTLLSSLLSFLACH